MASHLVIVESPAKARTIEKYLGKDFKVLASYGHVRDLIPKEGAVEVENGFRMNYELVECNQKHITTIKKALKKSDSIYLATDPDREGEAISWHLVELLREFMALDSDDIDINQLKWVVLMVLCNQPGNEQAFLWMEGLMAEDAHEALH